MLAHKNIWQEIFVENNKMYISSTNFYNYSMMYVVLHVCATSWRNQLLMLQFDIIVVPFRVLTYVSAV